MARKQKEYANSITGLSSVDFKYSGADYEYSTHQAENHHEQCGNSICRCSVIENAHITEIDTLQMARHICKHFNLNPLNVPYIERALRAIDIFTPNYWYINIGGGYYGQEVSGVYLDSGVALKAENVINQLLALDNDSKQVKLLLTLEYGYLLDFLQDKTFVLKSVMVNTIKVPQREYYRKLESKVVKLYTDNEPLVYGVVITDGDYNRVIDGYHRVAAARAAGKRKIMMWVGE